MSWCLGDLVSVVLRSKWRLSPHHRKPRSARWSELRRIVQTRRVGTVGYYPADWRGAIFAAGVDAVIAPDNVNSSLTSSLGLVAQALNSKV